MTRRIQRLIGGLVGVLVMVGTSVPAAHAWRPFAPTSFWNQPLKANAPLDPNSGALVTELRRQVAWGTSIATATWGVPVYNVPLSQPTVRVTLDQPPGDPDAPRLQAALEAVPIPPNAKPAAGTDGHLAIYQSRTETYWELFRAHKEADGWHASWGGRIEHQDQSPGYFVERQWGA